MDSNSKISAGFAARLQCLDPREKVRAIVLLHTALTPTGSTRRKSAADRQAIRESVRALGEQALAEIDVILARFHGKRLTDGVSALGSIVVAATEAGIAALAGSHRVKEILEDQPISALRAPRQPR